MPYTLARLDWKNWSYRLASAVISGGSAAVNTAVVSPFIDNSHFNPTTGEYYKFIGLMFLGTAVLKFFLFLSAAPLPDPVKVVTTTEVVEQPEPGKVVKTTVEKTKIEPPKAPTEPPKPLI